MKGHVLYYFEVGKNQTHKPKKQRQQQARMSAPQTPANDKDGEKPSLFGSNVSTMFGSGGVFGK